MKKRIRNNYSEQNKQIKIKQMQDQLSSTSSVTQARLSRLMKSVTRIWKKRKYYFVFVNFLMLLIVYITQTYYQETQTVIRQLYANQDHERLLISPTPILPEATLKIRPNMQFSFQMSKTLFSNPLGAPMTYTATMADGTPLENWIHFKDTAIAFEGRAPKKGTFQVRLNASIAPDPPTSTILSMIVINEPPTIQTTFEQLFLVVGENFISQIQVEDPNDDDLTHRITINGEESFPQWLKYDSQTQSFSGIPQNAEKLHVVFTVTDGEFNVSKEFYINSNPPALPEQDPFKVLLLVEEGGTQWHFPSQIFSSDDIEITKMLFDNKSELPKWLIPKLKEKFVIFHPHSRNSRSKTLQVELSDNSRHYFEITTRNINQVLTFLKRELTVGSSNANKDIYFEQVRENGDIITVWQDNQPNINFYIYNQAGHLIKTRKFEIKEEHDMVLVGTGPEKEGQLPLFFAHRVDLNTSLSLKITEIEDFETFQLSSFREILSDNYQMVQMVSLSEGYHYVQARSVQSQQYFGVLIDSNGILRSPIVPFERAVLGVYETEDNEIFVTEIKDNTLSLHKISRDLSPLMGMLHRPVDEAYTIIANDLVRLPDNKFILIWVERNVLKSSKSKLFGQYIRADLQPLEVPFLIHEYPSVDNFTIQGSYIDDGRLFIITEIRKLGEAKLGVTVLDTTNQKIIHWVEISRRGGSITKFPKITVLPSQNLHISWPNQIGPDEFLITSAILSNVFTRNYIPDIIGYIPDQKVMGGEAFKFKISNGLFTDFDGDYLYLTAKLSDGSPLPDWLTFEGYNGEFTAETRPMLEGVYEIVVKAKDSNLASVDTSFMLIVENDPGRYIFGFFLLFSLLFAFGVMIKDLIMDRIRETHQEQPEEIFFGEEEEDVVERFEAQAQIQQEFNTPVIVNKEDLERFMSNQTDKIPKMFLCPITGEVMADPWVVVTVNGGTCHSYEKDAIERWMKNHDTDPLTRHKRKSVGCNISLKHAIELYLSQLTIDELKNDSGLLTEVENWIKRRGGIEKLKADSNLLNLVEKVETAKRHREESIKSPSGFGDQEA